MNNIYEIGGNGFKKLSSAGKNGLEIGRVLQWRGYAEDQEVIIKRLNFDSTYGYGQTYLCINRRTKKEAQHQALTLYWEADKKLGIHIAITDEIASPDEVLDLVQAHEAQALIADAAKQKKAQAKEAGLKMLPSMYPHLEQVKNSKKSGHALGAANIKRELAREFPGVKFSVKSDSYSGGCSIDIDWTDGPTAGEVKKITDKYQYADFDGMTDSTNYRDEIFTDVFGGAKYVMEQRALSPARYAETACEMGYPESVLEQGRMTGVSYDMSDTIKSKTWEKSFYQKPEPKKEELKAQTETPKKARECTIGEYKGHPTITLPNGFTFGISKAKAILENLDEIRRFTEGGAV